MIASRERQIKKLRNLRASAASISATRYDVERVQSSSSGAAGYESAIIALADKEAEALRLIERYAHKSDLIRKQIDSLQSPMYVLILTGIYLDGLSLEDVADAVGYSYDRVAHLHGEALDVFEKKYFNEINKS